MIHSRPARTTAVLLSFRSYRSPVVAVMCESTQLTAAVVSPRPQGLLFCPRLPLRGIAARHVSPACRAAPSFFHPFRIPMCASYVRGGMQNRVSGV